METKTQHMRRMRLRRKYWRVTPTSEPLFKLGKVNVMSGPEPGSPEWLAAVANNPRWRYQDAVGRWHEGYVQHISDHGGTDITYWFRDATTGQLDLVSGLKLKRAGVIR